MNRTLYLIAYDITDDKRLNQVRYFLKGYSTGGQKSVYECFLTDGELGYVTEKLAWLIDEEEDDVRIYPLPSGNKVIVMGCGDRVPEGVEIFI